MQFNVASLLKEHTGASRVFAVDDDLLIDGERTRIEGGARLDRTPRGVLVRAELGGTARAPCSRCLRPVAFPLRISFEEEYLPQVDLVTGSPFALEDGEEDAYRISARHILDLSEPVRQYWSMALPMAPVCDDACAGICPVCGEERPAAGHACAPEPADARWAELVKLKLG